MAEHTITLNKGLVVGNEAQTIAVIREPTAGDLIAAMNESEKVVMVPTPNGMEPQLLLSNTAMGIHTLRRQIVKIGSVTGPLELVQLNLLSAEDLDALQKAAEALDSATAKQVDERGRSEAAGQRTE